ncbi:DNA helicase II [Legionella beliardensis]|uniref:DNA 3'-5' helicase n=1 Tax=Legionella beliardensis TaxID=91822 RepID=A0A378I421_9GAMM|nr:DNA helicase II [Legionella beliardensis]
MTAFLDGLNDEQRKAVTASLGNTLVLAGAGSGKTRVLISRIAWLIEHHMMSPYAILAVTFTNKAAGEMKARLNQLLNAPLMGLWVGTFHSLCHRLLRRHYQAAQLPEHFHILDSDDQIRIIKRVIAALKLDPEQWPFKQAQAFINNKKDEGLRPHHIQPLSYGPTRTLLQIYKSYEEACAQAGVIDFAELLLRTHELLRNNPDILAHYQQRFHAILVDEFQDTNAIQYSWIRLLAGDHASVMAVGDDDQSIYSWRGARVENIQQFSEDFKHTEVIRLEQNYRSTSTILSAANALIENNNTRMGKELWTAGTAGEKIIVYSAFNELDEARFVSERIAMAIKQGLNPNDMAVLYRSNAQSRVIEEALLRAGIAYRIHGGVRFFERAEIKDTLAYLRLIANYDDVAAFERVINFPARGIGEKTLDDIRDLAKQEQLSLWQAANKMLQEKRLPSRAALALMKFITLIVNLKQKIQTMALDEQISTVIKDSGLYDHFAKVKNDKAESRLDNLQELINAAKQFRYEQDTEEPIPILVAFLAHASLEAGEMQAQEHEQYVQLMTLHAAKGLEFPIVYLVGLEEGLFPSRQSVEEPGRLEEERRLCYVGMTRAMQKLIVTYAEIRRQYGREEYHKPSRFLREIPEELLDEIRVSARFQAPIIKPATDKSSLMTAKEAGIKIGQAVSHAKFGQGKVLSVEGSGAHTRVQVKFKVHGVKWLVLAYANLTLEGCAS